MELGSGTVLVAPPHSVEMTLVSIVTAPFNAIALPHEMDAPVVSVTL